MWDRHCAAASPKKPPAIVVDAGGTDGEDEFSEVQEAPGLQSTLEECFAAGESARKARIEASARKLDYGGGLPRGPSHSRGTPAEAWPEAEGLRRRAETPRKNHGWEALRLCRSLMARTSTHPKGP